MKHINSFSKFSKLNENFLSEMWNKLRSKFQKFKDFSDAGVEKALVSIANIELDLFSGWPLKYSDPRNLEELSNQLGADPSELSGEDYEQEQLRDETKTLYLSFDMLKPGDTYFDYIEPIKQYLLSGPKKIEDWTFEVVDGDLIMTRP
jgi:hypothetical protein